MCETGNQPAGHWHPVSEDDYVLHADHAAEVARLEARVAELTQLHADACFDRNLAQTERDSLRAQLEVAESQIEAWAFRCKEFEAQLEAANERHFQAVYALGVEIEKNEKKSQHTAQPDGVAVPKSLDIVLSTMRLALNLAEAEGEKPVQMDFKSAETLYVAARLLQKTAAPAREDRVRERRLELALAEIEGRSNVTTGGPSTLAQRLERIHALADQALAAPAPACDGYHHPQGSCPDCAKAS